MGIGGTHISAVGWRLSCVESLVEVLDGEPAMKELAMSLGDVVGDGRGEGVGRRGCKRRSFFWYVEEKLRR